MGPGSLLPCPQDPTTGGVCSGMDKIGFDIFVITQIRKENIGIMAL
jgi:hypothetical protein